MGFGFVLRTCEFKVVQIAYRHPQWEDESNNVLVYSLSTGSWKIKEDTIAPCYLTGVGLVTYL